MRFLYRIKQLIILTGDLFCFIIAYWAAISIRFLKIASFADFSKNIKIFFVVFVVWLVINYINGLYDIVHTSKNLKILKRIIESSITSLILSVAFFYLFQQNQVAPKTILILNIIIGFSLMFGWRCIAPFIIRNKKLSINTILVGITSETNELIKIINNDSNKAYRVTAIIDDAEKNKVNPYQGIELYKGLKTIRPAITTQEAELVVVAPHLRNNTDAIRELYELLFWPVKIFDYSSFYEEITGRIPPSNFSESWFLEHLKNTRQPVYDKLRTVIDYLSGIILGIIFLILFPFIATAIKLSSKGNIFYKQKRVGINGKVFTIVKFRSMFSLNTDGSAETGGAQFAEKEDKRVTIIGRFLRKTRLDELPQAWNLLRREVTLIGPRPERPEIVEKLKEQMPYYTLRHIVRPGLTGWAVIHQNYTSTLEEGLQKLQYDLYYIKNRSFVLDLSILLKTLNVVVRMMGQ